ncbi:RING/U-box superfamily protein [Rhynchospora pubera]|uniref:RING/U-box superfamily protein n=1 Tax=Rhynchospora pubera TaxID=906938 RepID=A0AAV8HLW3_9POAL|nr:RING/U-box superfamily protein [Rhynchospora pubera]
MRRANSNSSRSISTSGNGRGRRREQPVEVDQPFIDVEAIDDDEDVTILSSSQTLPLASNVSRRGWRSVVYLDDDGDVVEEVNPRQSGVTVEEDVRIVSGNSHNKRVRISSSADGSGNKNNRQTKRRTRNKVIEIQPELPQPIPVEVPPPPPPKEPTFSCPVCLSQLSEPCSTTCGHVFCQSCIKTAIQAQKKCPTCRKKLTNKGFHRLYLPNTAN